MHRKKRTKTKPNNKFKPDAVKPIKYIDLRGPKPVVVPTRDKPWSEVAMISYVWGPNAKAPVYKMWDTVNDDRYLTMCQRIKETGITAVWIDAVCIDQSNVKEKNTEVPKMGYAYEHGMITIIFDELWEHFSSFWLETGQLMEDLVSKVKQDNYFDIINNFVFSNNN